MLVVDLFRNRRVTTRVLYISLVISCAALGFGADAHAQAAPPDPTIAIAEKNALYQPSHMTSRVFAGLFTAVARAGKRLVAVGERGRIILSDDNGLNWRQIQTPTSVTLASVAFATPEQGWAVGGMGLVLHSSDGGLTWTKQLDGIQAANIALTAATAEIKQLGSNDTRSANLQSAQQLVAGGPTVPFLNVYTNSPNDVFIVGAFGMAYSSTDGGATWVSLADFLPNPNGMHLYQIMQDGDNFAAVGEEGLALYGPAGKPLATLPTPFSGTFFGAAFAKDRSWILFGLQGTILRSTDQGSHWTTIAAGSSVGIDCGITLKDGDILLGNIAGQLLLSHDNGHNYIVSALDESVVSLVQAADGTIIVAGPAGMRRVALDKLFAGT